MLRPLLRGTAALLLRVLASSRAEPRRAPAMLPSRLLTAIAVVVLLVPAAAASAAPARADLHEPPGTVLEDGDLSDEAEPPAPGEAPAPRASTAPPGPTSSPRRATHGYFTEHPADATIPERGDLLLEAGGRLTSEATGVWERSLDGGLTWAPVQHYAPKKHLRGPFHTSYTMANLWGSFDGARHRYTLTFDKLAPVSSEASILTVVPGQISINESPGSQEVQEGQEALFSARHGGSSSRAEVRWETSEDGTTWTELEGTRAPSEFDVASRLSIPAALDLDGRWYRAVFTNALTEATTSAARLTVVPALPVVSEHPGSVTVAEGGAVSLSSGYTGTAAPTTAQWEVSADAGSTWSDVADGGSDRVLTLDRATREMDGWQYRVRFTNAAGSAWSDAATLRVTFSIPAASGEAAPGESVELRVYDPESVRTGVMTIAAPAGTTIESVRHNSDVGPFQISEDGRTATSVRTVWGAAKLSAWVTLRVADDAVPGAVLDDGTVQVVDGEVLVASGSLAATVTGQIEVLEQPADVTVDVGTAAELTTVVSGHAVSTQWQISTDGGATWTDVDGATSTTLTLEATTPEMNRSWYRAVHTNAAGQVVTDHAVLLVRVAPYFVTNPAPEVFAEPGDRTTLSAQAADNVATEPIPLVWEYSSDGDTWEHYEPGTFPGLGDVDTGTLSFYPVLAQMDGVRFRAVAENHLGRTVSPPSLLTVLADPVIETQPADASTYVGLDATFSASTPAVSPHRTQQWQERTEGGEWTDVPGATDPAYSTGPTTLEMDQREYRVVFTNRHGSTASRPATLTVRTRPRASVTLTPRVRLVDQVCRVEEGCARH